MSEKVVNKKVFTAKVDGKDVELAVRKPDLKTQQKGQVVYSSEFCRLVKPTGDKPGAIVRAALDNVMRNQGLWDDAKQKRWDELQKSLLNAELRLAKGGGRLTELRNVAIQMRRDRNALRELLAARNELDTNTAEAQAENAKFNFYVATNTVYSTDGKPFFANEDDYIARAGEEAAQKAAQNMASLLYGLEENFEAKLPENKFLLEKKLVRASDLHLLDRDGNLVDGKGRRVNENGQLINDKGEPVDSDGNVLTETGEFKVEFVEPEDDFFTKSTVDEKIAV